MGVERLARKSFGFVIAALVAVAIYFQAAGAVELVAAKGLDAPAPSIAAGDAKAHRPRSKPSAQASLASGDPILSRNPFDSVTGPLDRNPISLTPPTVAAEMRHLDLSDPLNAPECDNVVLNIVSESTDPVWSVA